MGLLTLGAASLYAVFSLQQYRHLRTSSYDSVIFDQAVRAYAHLHLPVVLVKNVHNDLAPGTVLLGDHFSPVLALLAPLYWVWADVPALLVAQAVLFASSIPVVWIFVRRILGAAAAYAIGTAYALAWGFSSALATDFHEIAFAVPLVAAVLERAQARRPGQAALAATGLLLVKEDMGPLVAMFGVYLAVLGWRRVGLALAVGGILAFELTLRVVIPHFGGDPAYYWTYGALGPDLPSAASYAVRHPLDVLRIATTPHDKVRTMLWLFAPWGFLPLASPIILLTLPVLAERMLSTNFHYWLTAFHYNAVLMPVLALGAADGLARVLRLFPSAARPRLALGAALAALLVAVAAVPLFAFKVLFTSREWRTSANERAASRIVAAVPDGVTVEADSRLGPHLTRRTRVLLLDQKPRGAPWVAMDIGRRYFPFEDVESARVRYAYLLASGYTVAAEAGGFRLLRAP